MTLETSHMVRLVLRVAAALVAAAVPFETAPHLAATVQTTAAERWQTHVNATYGYEIRIPEGFEVVATGPEGRRDGASFRVRRVEFAAPAPVLDVDVRADKADTIVGDPAGMRLERAPVTFGGQTYDQTIYRFTENQEIAIVEWQRPGLRISLQTGAGVSDIRGSVWWAIVQTFRQSASTPALMPVPASIAYRSGRVAISNASRVVVRGFSDARLKAGIDRLIQRLQGRTGFVLPRDQTGDAAAAAIVIDVKTAGLAIPALEEDESYSIEAASQVTLRANTVVGALRGLETIRQLLSGDAGGFFIPAVTIQDAPRFRWRGLLLDVGRHFEPVEVIKRQLDAMAAVKLNVLHFHLSEDQGFRVESRRFPKLHEMGSDGQYYTQDQLRELVAYARDRGIRVVPEFDMPGHVSSWIVAYPQLGSGDGPYTMARKWGVFDPAFDPTREETYKFIDTFIGEIAPVFPDAYWHIGGDENNGKEWAANKKIQAFMQKRGLKDAHALQTYFNQRLLAIVRKHGKRMMGWDEIFQPGLPKETVVHSWRGQKSLFDAAKQGYDGVLSAGYYIDLLETARRHYTVDPLPANSGLTDEEAAHILGGEATMWGEWVGPETIDSRIWPRTAAIAERFWSPREVADVDDMYRRLDVVSVQLEELGLTHLRNGDVLLRRLAGSGDLAIAKVVADVVEPVKGYQRGGQQPWMTSLGPLTHLVDAVSTDSPGARRISTALDALLSDLPRFGLGRDQLRQTFSRWRDAKAGYTALVDRAPGLRETLPLAEDLAALGEIGLQALVYLESRGTPLLTWRDGAVAVIDRARPKAALEFPFLPLMRELVFAAMEQSKIETMTAAEWRASVKALAAPPRRGRGGPPGGGRQ